LNISTRAASNKKNSYDIKETKAFVIGATEHQDDAQQEANKDI